MGLRARHPMMIAVVALAAALAWVPAESQQTATADGMVVRLGIVPAEVALRAEGHREAHPQNPIPGSQHLLITLDDKKTGARIADAEVVVELTDPRGHVSTKPLLHTQAGGLADYSELFEFGWSGEYSIRVTIRPHSGPPVETRFKVHHTI
jgi:hypothetical protein